MTSTDQCPVLVTGGAGYIGSHAVWALHDAGWPVVVLDNLSTGFRFLLPDDVPLIEGDVADDVLVGRILREHGICAVMHFAGSIVVPESVADPLKYYANNTVASRALLEAAIQAGIDHFLFSSTASVYGTSEAQSVTEDEIKQPINPYGWSKLMTEQMLADAAVAHDFNFCVLRYFNVAGADPKGRTGQSTIGATHLIKVACEVASGKRSHVDVFGGDFDTPDGTGIRDYIHVSDLAAAHVLALEALIAQPNRNLTMNCGYGKGFSVLEVLDTVDRLTNSRIDRRMAARRPGDPAMLVSNPARIRATLPWEPQHADLAAIVRDALAWESKLATIEK